MSNIRVFEYDSAEYEKLTTAVTLLNAFDKDATYTVEVTYFDFGQDWKWTTIIVDRHSKWGGYQIYPNQQKAVIDAETMEELVEACKAIMKK